MIIEPRKTYRIKGDSPYFKDKYATSNPLIIIEGPAETVFGSGIHLASMSGNWAARLFLERVVAEDPPGKTAYYGHEVVTSLGECVFDEELEEVTQ
jgi:hypothetical protein